jgi:hypothetical protein
VSGAASLRDRVARHHMAMLEKEVGQITLQCRDIDAVDEFKDNVR